MREIEEFLAARGAAEIDHPGGTLLAHVRRTHDTLEGWGARPALRLAGLAHAAYGTHGFAQGLLEVSERPALAELIGAEAEAIVYTYGACDRTFTFPQVASGRRVTLKDRFTGEVSELPPQQIHDLVELTFADELDVLAHNDDLRTEHGAGLHRLFTACRAYASDPANAAVARFFA